MSIPLILASGSPRRRELLLDKGLEFDVLPPDDDAEDDRKPNETPDDYVRRLADQKARNVASKVSQGRIVACDTLVLCRDEILGKALDRDDARRMLRFLRGSRHFVLSGLCVLLKTPNAIRSRIGVETTELYLHPISDAEIETYLDSAAWQGKAGAFGYQDRHSWISLVRGSESNVVGLPMELLEMLLREI